MSTPNPRHIAYAISDHAAEQVRESQRYLDAWASLRASGVPALQLRHVLDLPAKATEARDVIDEWERMGSRGLLALVGAQDCGKSDAQTRWAHRRHLEGLSTMWVDASGWAGLSFGNKNEPNEIAALIKAAKAADALIIDDVGAPSTQGPIYREKMTALILARAQRPTVISGNLNMAELTAWLGPQIGSRLHETGRAHHIPGTLSMREDDGVLDPDGRSPAWFAARKMVDYFGCERVQRAVMKTVTVTPEDGAEYTYDEPTGEYVEALDVGGRLAEMASSMPDEAALAKLKKTCDRMGTSWGEITAEAKRLGRVEELVKSGMLETVKGFEGLELPRMPRPELEMKRAASMGAPPKLGKPAEFFTGGSARRRLHAAGFRVERVTAGFKVLFGESVIHPCLPTNLLAWELAAGMTSPLACGVCGSVGTCEHGLSSGGAT